MFFSLALVPTLMTWLLLCWPKSWKPLDEFMCVFFCSRKVSDACKSVAIKTDHPKLAIENQSRHKKYSNKRDPLPTFRLLQDKLLSGVSFGIRNSHCLLHFNSSKIIFLSGHSGKFSWLTVSNWRQIDLKWIHISNRPLKSGPQMETSSGPQKYLK